jgi:glycosyltransferase involved in cell wall biosynthesis
MRICYVCHQFFPDCYTGTERYTLELAKQLQRMGHQICIFTYALKELATSVTAKSGLARVEYDYEGIPVIALRHRDLDSRGGLTGISFDLGDSIIREEAERVITERAFDVMHCVHPMRIGAALEPARRRGLKVVLTLMDYWMICPRVTLQRADGSVCNGPDQGRNCATFCYQSKDAIEPLLERYADSVDILAWVDAVVSHSRFLISIFKQSGIDTRRFIHCSNGFNYARIASVQKRKRGDIINFGFLGTILPHKGVDVLVDAFKRVLSNRIRLKVYGACFGEHEYYSRLLANAEGDKRIEFCGDYDFNNIGRVLDEIDVVVVPSLWYENAPLVIGAAQAFGIPVIATRLGGMKEMVIDGVNGFTFELGRAEQLADKIRLIAANPGLMADLSKNRMQPPRIESEAFLLETLYYGLIGRSRNDRAAGGLSLNSN